MISDGPARWGIAACALFGLVVSWCFFASWGLEHGPDLVGFWTSALWGNSASGLVWDLVASGGVLTVVTLHHAPRLGRRRVGLILAGTWILGVCVGLGMFLLMGRPVDVALRAGESTS